MLLMILAEANEKDRSKLSLLFKTHMPMMLFVARKYLSDVAQAEDAVLETFLRVIDNLEKISEIDCPETRGFLVIIVRNVALDMLRKHGREEPYDETSGLSAPGESLYEGLSAKEATDLITECVKSLPPEYADILQLKITYECSTAKLAGMLGISEVNARKRLQRAREALKKELERRGYTHD